MQDIEKTESYEQMRRQKNADELKEYEARHEVQLIRRRRIIICAVAAVLLICAVIVTVTLVRYRRYIRAEDFYTAGEYEQAAEAFMEMADYKDAKVQVYLSAVALYRQKEYEKALPFFVWLDGSMDNGYYLRKCQEKLGLTP